MRIGLIYLAAIIYLAAAAVWQVFNLPVPLVHRIPLGPMELPAMQTFVGALPLAQLLVGVGGFAILYGALWWIAQDFGYDALTAEPDATRHPFLDSGGISWLNVGLGGSAVTLGVVGFVLGIGDLVFFSVIALLAVSAAVVFGQRARVAAAEAEELAVALPQEGQGPAPSGSPVSR